MLIEIIKNGNYKEFERSGGVKAQRLQAGEVVEFPEDYANYLITVGLGKAAKAKAPATKPLTLPEPAKETPVEKDETAPDPGVMTVAEIRALDLDKAGWQALLAAEKAGKGRSSAIEFIEAQL